MTPDFLEEKLKTLTVKKLAIELNVPAETLRGKIKRLSIDVRQIKHEHALSVLTEMSNKKTFEQMCDETGFSLRKVKYYSSRYGINSMLCRK